MSSEVLKARSAVGVATRRGDREAIITSRQQLAVAKLEAYVSRVVAEAPPLSPEQLDRLAVLFRPGGGV